MRFQHTLFQEIRRLLNYNRKITGKLPENFWSPATSDLKDHTTFCLYFHIFEVVFTKTLFCYKAHWKLKLLFFFKFIKFKFYRVEEIFFFYIPFNIKYIFTKRSFTILSKKFICNNFSRFYCTFNEKHSIYLVWVFSMYSACLMGGFRACIYFGGC